MALRRKPPPSFAHRPGCRARPPPPVRRRCAGRWRSAGGCALPRRRAGAHSPPVFPARRAARRLRRTRARAPSNGQRRPAPAPRARRRSAPGAVSIPAARRLRRRRTRRPHLVEQHHDRFAEPLEDVHLGRQIAGVARRFRRIHQVEHDVGFFLGRPQGLLAEPERTVAVAVEHFAQEPADRVAGQRQAFQQAHRIAEAGRVPQQQAVARRRGLQRVRFGEGGHVGGVAHFSHVGADQGARQGRLAVVRMRYQRELDFYRELASRRSSQLRQGQARAQFDRVLGGIDQVDHRGGRAMETAELAPQGDAFVRRAPRGRPGRRRVRSCWTRRAARPRRAGYCAPGGRGRRRGFPFPASPPG